MYSFKRIIRKMIDLYIHIYIYTLKNSFDWWKTIKSLFMINYRSMKMGGKDDLSTARYTCIPI